MLDNKSNFHRVFFHELGHFVAHIINERYHGGLGISEISFTKYEDDYEGAVTPIASEGWIKETPPPINRLVQTILRLEHGCLFEAYFLQTTIETCVKLHGKMDYTLRRNILDHHRKFGYAEELSTSMDNFLQRLKDNKTLESFLSLTPEKYILSSDEKIIIDHEMLKLDIKSSIDIYEAFYEEQYHNELRLLQINREQ